MSVGLTWGYSAMGSRDCDRKAHKSHIDLFAQKRFNLWRSRKVANPQLYAGKILLILRYDPGNDVHGRRGHKADADQPQLSFCCPLLLFFEHLPVPAEVCARLRERPGPPRSVIPSGDPFMTRQEQTKLTTDS